MFKNYHGKVARFAPKYLALYQRNGWLYFARFIQVISDDLETMPGVAILINDTVEVGETDLDGFFQIDIPVSEKKLLFRAIGLDPATIELVDKCDEVEIIMMLTGTYDFMTLRRAERKRKKRFKKLPQIHKQAFEKGIFKTVDACSNRKFEPYFLDEN